jgi:serine/threonine protein phosphatase PrpC
MSNFNKNLDNENNNNNNEKNHSHHRSHHHHHSRSKSKNKNNDSKEIENYEKHHKRNNENKIREFSTPEIQHKHKSKAKIENNQNEKLMKMKHKILSNPEIKIKIDKEENKVKHSYIFSRAGKIEDQKEKTNQDSYLKIEHINGFEDFNIYGIFDGHGSSGHLVSKFIVNYLTEYYKYNEEILKRKTIENIYSFIKKKNYLFIKESIKKSEEALFDSEEIDSTFSGTTCILIFIIGTKIISVNIGDSRAIMLNEKKKIIELSIDQKPENLEEKERIEKNGGEIRKIIENNEEIGPMRVWAKGKKYPGIAMSRSIGDSVANEIGVWSLPDIKEYNIQYNSQFIVIGSDGLWEFMSNDKVCKFVYKCKNKSHIQDYLEKLVEKSRKYWEKYDCNIDDITVILITFNYFYKEDNENED